MFRQGILIVIYFSLWQIKKLCKRIYRKEDVPVEQEHCSFNRRYFLAHADMIAQSVDNLGDQFRPAMCTGWLKYIRNAYQDGGAVVGGPAVGEGPLVVPD